MKKIVISLLLAVGVLGAFGFSDISSGIKEVATSTKSMFNDDSNTSTTRVDTECTNPMDNYKNNYREALKIAGVYCASNSSSFMNLISSENSNTKENSKALKLLTKEIAKKTVWLPIEIEKKYGEQIYKSRLKNEDVVLRSTKNRKYKKMYKKLDLFVKKYNTYLEKNDYLKNNSYPFKIKIFILSSKNRVEAIPGGYIFISEDFIKGKRYRTVLAHELTHISKRHLTKDLQYRLINGYDNIADIIKLIKKLNEPNVKQKDIVFSSLVSANLIYEHFEKHTQDQELEADACSLKILTSINQKRKKKYVQELIKNIDITMQDEQDANEMAIFTFQEHPNKKVRINNIKNLSQKL
ncbi:MAG: M48 family metalloprotease [Candidatus Gracilibacteria bacterium]